MSRFRRFVVAAVLAIVCLQQVAFADNPTKAPITVAPPSDSKNANVGVDGMVKAPNLRGGNQPMLFEKYAALDYEIHVDPGSALIGAVTNPTNTPGNQFGNLVAEIEMTFVLAMGVISTRAVEWALSLDLVTAASGPVGAVVNGLHQHFYGQLQPWAILALCFVLAWALVMGRVLRAAGIMAWGVIAIVIAGIFMANPTGYLNDVQEFTNWTSQSALSSIGAVDAAGVNRDPTTTQGTAQNAELRTFANRAWALWVYQPWTFVQFGQDDPKVPGTNRQLGVELLDKNSGRNSTFDADFQAMPQGVKDWYNGDHGIERAGAGLVAMILAAAALTLLGALVLMIVLFDVGVLILAMGAAIIFVVAIIPGVGQMFLLRWLGKLLQCFAGTVVVSIFLALVMLLAGILATLTAGWGWFIAAVLQVALLAWAFQHRRTFLSLSQQAIHPKQQTAVKAPVLQRPMAADRHLLRAQQRVALPLRSHRALAGGGARLGQAGAAKPALAAGRSAVATGGTTAAATVGTAGVALAGVAALKTGRAAVRGLGALHHHSSAAIAGFVTGTTPPRPPRLRSSSGPSVMGLGLAMASQQVRTANAAKRLPPPSSGRPTPPPTRAVTARRPPNRLKSGGGRPPIQLNASGAKVTPAPVRDRRAAKWNP